MTSKEYWQRREEEKLKSNLKSYSTVKKKVKNNLDKAANDIEKEILNLYTRYSNTNQFSFSEAQKLLTKKEYSTWRKDLQGYVDEIMETGNKELLIELNTLSTKSQISILEEKLYHIQKILNKDYVFKHKEVEALLKHGVKESFTRTAFSIESVLGFHSDFSMISEEDIKDIINLPWSGKNYSERLWKNRTLLKNKIEEQLTKSIIQGKDLKQCAKEIKVLVRDDSMKVAEKLINTEHAYACGQGDLKIFEEFNIKEYEYLATLDLKTSQICRKLDGQTFAVSEAIPGVNFPPMHPNCRSTTVPATKTLKETTRIAKNRNNEYIYIDSDVTYEEYKKALETNNWNIKPETKMAFKYANKLIKTANNKDKTITPLLKNIVSKGTGELKGLEYRVKSKESLVRKLKDKSYEKKISIEEYAKDITDILRFTNVSSNENLTKDCLMIIEELKKKGYNIIELTNTLGDKKAYYRGINSLVESKDGYVFELQFHTPQSLEIKELNHKLYEEQRLLETTEERKVELAKEMYKNSKKIPIPIGVENIGG